jgi:hypothetical protein
MFNRDNAVGFVLLGVCVALAAVMLYYINIGDRPRWNIGGPASLALMVIFFGLMIFGVVKGGALGRLRRGQSGPQWPDPSTGRKSLWDRLRGR